MTKYILILLIFFITNWSFSSNLNIQNVSMPTSSTVQFTISWDNSWYINSGPSNWDAIWVIVKFQDCSSPTKVWRHANLSSTSSDHSQITNILRVDAVTDKKGVFVRRDNLGAGTIAPQTLTLQLDQTQSPMPQTSCNIEVVGFEMVAVPQGGFSMGSGSGTSTNSVPPDDLTEFNSNQINSSNYNTIINANFFQKASSNTSKHYSISATFPKGYENFYCMKYEITQIQYVTFLNQLSLIQQRERVINNPKQANAYAFGGSYRNFIKVVNVNTGTEPATFGVDLNSANVYNSFDDGHHIACNYLNFDDLKAFLDWAALRPMTEFEYEKAARGTLPPVANEFIYGGTSSTIGVPPVVYGGATSASLNNPGTGSETSFLNTGHIAFGATTSSLYGPLRVGFAATNATNRISAAASFYGILDLSGNVNELVYMIGPYTNAYNIFDGKLGDGRISQFGHCNEETWPGEFSAMCRGGSYNTILYRLSQRFSSVTTTYGPTSKNAGIGGAQNRIESNGGRGVRQF